MAKLTLTIYGYPEEEAKGGKIDITIGSERVEGKLTKNMQNSDRDSDDSGKWESGDIEKVNLNLSINTFSVHQKMYAPDEILAEIYITAVTDGEGNTRMVNFTKDEILGMFSQKRVSLTWSNANDDFYTVGSDYYVNEVVPRKYADKIYVTLKICSPDKLLTIKPYSRSWTAKKLYSDILCGENGELQNYKLPYDKAKKVACDATKMKHIVKDSQEHIFPYLVQYNESFYDLLARTTNRWGEFMYYYNGKLHIGFDADEENAEEISNYYSVTYRDYKSTQPQQENAGTYVTEANYDDNVLNSEVMKSSAARVMMTINHAFDSSRMADNYWFMKVGQLLTNRQSLLNFIIGAIVNDLTMWLQIELKADDKNDTFDDLYFNGKTKKHVSMLNEQYYDIPDVGKFYNQFSEGKPFLNATEYAKTLVGEFSAADNTVEIDYDTYAPSLHIGQIIKVDGNPYIVTEISATQPEVLTDIGDRKYQKSVDTSKVLFRVTAISKVTITENGKTVLDDADN